MVSSVEMEVTKTSNFEGELQLQEALKVVRSTRCTVVYTDGSKKGSDQGSSYIAITKDDLGNVRLDTGICLRSLEQNIDAIEYEEIAEVIRKFDTRTDNTGIIIFTDSQNAIRKIAREAPYIQETFPNIAISLNYVPAHKGVSGNEVVDKSAGLSRKHLGMNISISENLMDKIFTESLEIVGSLGSDLTIQPGKKFTGLNKILPRKVVRLQEIRDIIGDANLIDQNRLLREQHNLPSPKKSALFKTSDVLTAIEI